MSQTTAAIADRNRNNARHSTGPRTPQGKAIASQNARKHSFTVATHQILATEDPAAYAAFEEELVSIYGPKSPREHLAAVEIAQCRWALRRFDEAEVSLLNTFLADHSLGAQCITSHGEPLPVAFVSLDLLYRYRRPWDRRHQQALREFNQARLDRNREERLVMAEQHQAMKIERQARQQTLHPPKSHAKQTRSQKHAHDMQHRETPRQLHPMHTLTPASGFVSSPAPTPSRPGKCLAV